MEKSEGWLWQKINRRRLELIEREFSRDLSEDELAEQRRLAWLANHLPSEWTADSIAFLFEPEKRRDSSRDVFLWEEDTEPLPSFLTAPVEVTR